MRRERFYSRSDLFEQHCFLKSEEQNSSDFLRMDQDALTPSSDSVLLIRWLFKIQISWHYLYLKKMRGNKNFKHQVQDRFQDHYFKNKLINYLGLQNCRIVELIMT